MLKRWSCAIFICAVFLLSDSNIFISEAFAIAESTGIGGSNAIAVHLLGETGNCASVGLMSVGNVRDTHLAFKDSEGDGHVFNYDFISDDFDVISHDTWVAGILASRGTCDFPDRVGVASGADVYCGKVQKNGSVALINFYNVLNGLVVTLDCDVVMIAFALSLVADGESDWTLMCDYFAYNYDVVFALAAGNNNKIDAFGDAYNGITTAGLILTDPLNPYDYRTVGSDSGQGLTEDGRRKPDICMPSQGQTMPDGSSDSAWLTWTSNKGETSFALPHCAGEAGLLCSAADKTSTTKDNHSEVIKAVMINSTFPNINDKQNSNTNPAMTENAWQYQRGYGRGDCLRGYELITSPEIVANKTTTNLKGWAYDSLSPNQSDVYYVYVPKNCRLVATLAWNRRVRWIDTNKSNTINSGELTGYLANLDLEIYEPSNATAIFSESRNGLNADDNVEKCDILATKPGGYTVAVKNKSNNGESASYGLAFEVLKPLEGDLEPIDYIVDLQDLKRVSESWLREDSDIDLFGEGRIDFADFAGLMNSWLGYDPKYYP